MASVDQELRSVAVGDIVANTRQPREVFEEGDLASLSASIAEVGVLQPLVVRVLDGGGFELVAGERRLRAAIQAGLPEVPVVVRDARDEDLLPLALVENLQRVDLNPMELAGAYQAMVEDFGMTHEGVANVLGVERSKVTHTVSLLRLPGEVQRRVAAGVLSAGHARLLVSLGDPGVAALLAERIVAEGLSVQATRELIALGNLPGREEVDGRAEGMAQKRRRGRSVPAEFRVAEEYLEDRLDTRVRVLGSRTRGRIVVDFAGEGDLQRVLDALSQRSDEAG